MTHSIFYLVALLSLSAGPPPPVETLRIRAQLLVEEARDFGQRGKHRRARRKLEQAGKILEDELSRIRPVNGEVLDGLLNEYSQVTGILVELHRRTSNAGARQKAVERAVQTLEALLARSHALDTDAFERLAQTYVRLLVGMIRELHTRSQRVGYRRIMERLMSTFETLMKVDGAAERRSKRPLARTYAELSRRLGVLHRNRGQVEELVALLTRIETHLTAFLGAEHRAVARIARARRRLQGPGRTPVSTTRSP